MRRVVELTPRAQDDLDAVRTWQLQPGAGRAAHVRLKAIQAAILNLRRFPCAYPKEFSSATRTLIVERHRIVFELNPDTNDNATAGNVLILRIYGPGRSPD